METALGLGGGAEAADDPAAIAHPPGATLAEDSEALVRHSVESDTRPHPDPPPKERTPRTLCAPCSLEPASGPPHPSLSPSEGERVPEGRVRGERSMFRAFSLRGDWEFPLLGGGEGKGEGEPNLWLHERANPRLDFSGQATT